MNIDQGKAYLFALLNAVVIGMSFFVVKITLDYAPPLDSLTYRFAAACLLMLIPIGVGIVKLNYKGKPIYQLFLLSTMYPLGFFMLQAFGLQHATSAEGGIINAFTPVVTMVFASIFLKEVTTLWQKLSISLSVFGVIFIFLMKGSKIDLSMMSGIILLLLACIAFAVYSVLTRSISKHFSPAEISYFMIGIGFPILLSISLFTHLGNGTMNQLIVPLTSRTFIFSIFYLGLVQLATAFLSSYALSKLEASKMSVFTNLSTIISIVVGAIFLHEEVTWYHVIGSLMIVIGVIGTNWLGRKSKKSGKLASQHL